MRERQAREIEPGAGQFSMAFGKSQQLRERCHEVVVLRRRADADTHICVVIGGFSKARFRCILSPGKPVALRSALADDVTNSLAEMVCICLYM